MGVPQLRQLLEAYSAYREWKGELDGAKEVNGTLYIDFTGIAYGVMCKHFDDEIKRQREENAGAEENIDYAKIFEKLSYRNIADDIFETKVVKFLPHEDDFHVLKNVKKIFIAHDNRAPVAKARIQEKRRQNRIAVPKDVRDAVADQFYLAVLDYKELLGFQFDVVYDKTQTIGEGEWKCIREIWKDINEGRTEACYILANDFDVVVGAYCLPKTSSAVNVVWKRQRMENYCLYESKIINWYSENLLEKLLIVAFLNVYGNDYVPGLITATSNISMVKSTVLRAREILLYNKREDLCVSLDKISEFIFGNKDDRPIIETEEWITSLTFLIFFVYDMLLNLVFRRPKAFVETHFFEKWSDFLRNKDDITEDVNECREYVVTMVLWYLGYCTSAFRRSDEANDERGTIFEALPLKTPFSYNDERTKFCVELTNKRSLFDHNDESCIKNVYCIINKIFTS